MVRRLSTTLFGDQYRGVLLAMLCFLLGSGILGIPSLTTPAQAITIDLPRQIMGSYLGGSAVDYGRAVAFDAQGNIYLAGDTFSPSILGQNLNLQGGSDIVVAKLSPDAKQLLGLFSIGSTTWERVGSMAVTPAGEVVLLVETASPDFPLKNALNTVSQEFNPGVLLKIDAALNDLVFSTYTTFTVDVEKRNVAVDSAGVISVAGFVYDPFTRARELVLQRFSADGQQLLFEKIWDGDFRPEFAEELLIRPDGSTVIVGYTEGQLNDLPVTANAVQPVCGRKLALGEDHDCDRDAFVIIVSAGGEVTYTSYLGGNGSDAALGAGVDALGALYLVGDTTASDFPTTAGAFQERCVQAKPEDGCYYDGFIAKLSPDGSQLVYSSYLGSQELGGLDYPRGIAVDSEGNATVAGFTASELWPVKNAVQPALNAAPCPNAFQDRLCFDSVIATFDPNGELLFSSYLGGKFDETTTDVALGADGSIYLTGYTESFDYPVSDDSVQPTPRSGVEFFLARIGLNGSTAPGPGPGSYNAYLPLVIR